MPPASRRSRHSRPTQPDPRWLTLGEASRLLGVSTATIRRWSDAGRLRAFTTPGGHRRFSSAALEGLLPADRTQRPPLGTSGLTSARLSRVYRRDAARPDPSRAWLASLDTGERDAFRLLGRQLAMALVAHLDAIDEETRRHQLSEGTTVAAEYGRRGAALGLSLSEVVEGFLAFRRPFLAEMEAAARRRGIDAVELSSLHADADRAMDRLLVATMSGHSIRRVRGARSSRQSLE